MHTLSKIHPYAPTLQPAMLPAAAFMPTALEAAVGHTPLLPLHRIAQAEGIDTGRVQVFAKAEWFNPGGSVKDRPALYILRAALREGLLPRGKRLLDSTSGNMGIAYATFGAALGIPITLTIPENASPERIKILRALGAELILTDPFEGSDGAMLVARELAATHPTRYYYANQYDNPANWQAHFDTTGPEIWAQTSGALTHFVAGLGTSGTFTGTSRFLHTRAPQVARISFEPDASFHGLEGLKHMETALRPGIYHPDLATHRVTVRTEDAYAMTHRLAREEGLFVGISAGAAAVAALQTAHTLTHGLIATVFPDNGYKYLSERLWNSG